MAVHKMTETPIATRLRLIASPEDAPDLPIKPARPVKDDTEAKERREQRTVAVMVHATAILTALARVISARLILLIALLGCLSLGVLATFKPSGQGLVAMGLFGLVTVALVLLESGVLNRIGAKE